MSDSQAELRRYTRVREQLIAHLGGVCVRCGTNEDLQFDHVDPSTKEYAISVCWSMPKVVWVEIEKCQLLCEECHKEKSLSEYQVAHNRWRYEKHKCRCDQCRADYRIYRRERYLRTGY